MSLSVERLKLSKSGTNRGVNAYLLSMGNVCILVDCGFEEHFDFLKKKIGKKILMYLIITHSHLDHCGSAFELKKHFNCKIVITEYENEKLKKGFNSDLIPRTKEFEEFLKTLKGGEVYPPVDGDILIKNDSSFVSSGGKDDFKLKIIMTPGHTSGSISVISKVTKEVFVGDLLNHGDFKGFGKSGFLHSEEGFKTSMKKLLENNEFIEKIWTGHNDKAIPFEDFVEFCKEKGYRF